MRSGLSSLKGSWMGRDNQAVIERKVWMIPRRTHLNLRFEFIRLRPRTPRPPEASRQPRSLGRDTDARNMTQNLAPDV